MDMLAASALALGAAWASGINVYATVLLVGGLGAMGAVELPPDLQALESPTVLLVAAGLYAIEFLADKIPGVDSLNDAVHTFIRVPAGALLAAGAVSGMDAEWQTALALVAGGVVAAGSHLSKAGTRVLANASPEPFSNIFLSLAEDVAVIGGLLLAVFKPVAFLVLLGLFALAAAWLLPKVWRGVGEMARRIRGWFGGASAAGTGDASFADPGPDPKPPAAPARPKTPRE